MENKNKRGFWGRLLKFALWSFAIVFLLAVLMVASLPLWISPVATSVAGSVVPGYTGTDFRITRFCLNPYSGSLCVNGVKLSNPKGFGESAAFSLSNFNVEVAVGSLFSDTILVKEIVIEDAFASYYSHDGKNNFDVILANVEKATGPKGEKSEAKDKKQDSAGKKVIIERLRIAGTKVKLMKSDMMPPLMLPTVELTDIGKKSNGATLEEAWTQISEAVMKSMASIGDGIGALGGLLGDGAKDVSGILNSGAKDVASALEGVTGKTGASLDAVKKSGAKLLSGASGTSQKTADVVGDTAKGAVDAVGGVAKDTVDAVGNTTKKAAEGVKNLFKGFGK